MKKILLFLIFIIIFKPLVLFGNDLFDTDYAFDNENDRKAWIKACKESTKIDACNKIFPNLAIDRKCKEKSWDIYLYKKCLKSHGINIKNSNSHNVQKEKNVAKNNNNDQELFVIGSGTGFFVNNDGFITTNAHVAGICQIMASLIDGKIFYFKILALDEINDIALLRGDYKNKSYLNINSLGADFGEDIMAFGFPLAENLSSSVKLTKGIVSSLSGPQNNVSLIQIDAAIQPGNSGGPVLNYNGQVVGMASSGLNKLAMLQDKESPYIPENVNFAVASSKLTSFLKANQVKIYSKKINVSNSSDLAKIGMHSTIHLFCLNTKQAYENYKNNENYNDVILRKVINLK